MKIIHIIVYLTLPLVGSQLIEKHLCRPVSDVFNIAAIQASYGDEASLEADCGETAAQWASAVGCCRITTGQAIEYDEDNDYIWGQCICNEHTNNTHVQRVTTSAPAGIPVPAGPTSAPTTISENCGRFDNATHTWEDLAMALGVPTCLNSTGCSPPTPGVNGYTEGAPYGCLASFCFCGLCSDNTPCVDQ